MTVCSECSEVPETRGEYLQRGWTRSVMSLVPNHWDGIPSCDGLGRHAKERLKGCCVNWECRESHRERVPLAVSGVKRRQRGYKRPMV